MIVGEYHSEGHTVTLYLQNLAKLSLLFDLKEGQQVEKAVFLILCHELVHAYQSEKSVPMIYYRNGLTEGHATLVQDVIAQKNDIYEIQLKGEYIYFNFNKVMAALGLKVDPRLEPAYRVRYGYATDYLFRIYDQGSDQAESYRLIWREFFPYSK